MHFKAFKTIFILLVITSQFSFNGSAQDKNGESHLEVSMRMIGHRVLLKYGDSTSRILPIVKEDGKYRIQFETFFEFDPEDLVATIDSVVQETNLAKRYLVEVENCVQKEIVYSYEVGDEEASDVVPCRTRRQPIDCYNLLITIFDSETSAVSPLQKNANGERKSEESSLSTNLIIIGGIGLLALGLYFRRKKELPETDSNIISIGAFQFDKRNMVLSLQDDKIELTGKESDLLHLLYLSVNTTVEREIILKNVWGDEGDYVGRTLDVFISKLRKKLEADPNLKIANIRGVGYRLVLNDSQ